MEPGNLFKKNNIAGKEELFDTLLENKNLKIESIVSAGHTTPENTWYDQQDDEWVILLKGEAEILFEKENNKVQLREGDYILIPAHCKHRVTYTSTVPQCIWLAVHIK
ncbi:MAG TPA: cupin domain-containing protein [Bacteroidales bacterium]|nr:cupin domain-containing protein [Bacteroidales bacterium]HPS17340.1 cupin domain-containing protein [Bacteroidales bacterium]